MAQRKYDIFISYRRDGGAQYARILQLMLAQRGYKVFLDYDELTDGIFSDHIKAAIKDAEVFMLVLSERSLARCVNEDDWVRQEILLALDQGKHFVPVNPDNKFDGVPDAVPERIKTAVGSHQHSEINFGQALGVTTDLMIKNRLVPTLGERLSTGRMDTDMDAAKETLRRQDAHQRFMKRLGIAGLVAVIAIVLGTCLLFWRHQGEKENLSDLRAEMEKKYSQYGLYLNADLTEQQMLTIDDILSKMAVVRPDTLWMSQFEFTVGQWHGVLGSDYDADECNLPMTEKSYGEICMVFLDSLRNMTNLEFDLPSAEEWGYAARGANRETTLYAGSDKADEVAWYRDNADGKVHASDGQQGKLPNTLDLYDMSGNVSELCNTPFGAGADGVEWTVCGGNYESSAEEVTVTSKAGISTDAKEKTVGFRLVIRKEM